MADRTESDKTDLHTDGDRIRETASRTEPGFYPFFSDQIPNAESPPPLQPTENTENSRLRLTESVRNFQLHRTADNNICPALY